MTEKWGGHDAECWNIPHAYSRQLRQRRACVHAESASEVGECNEWRKMEKRPTGS